jgi:hypothetical protein
MPNSSATGGYLAPAPSPSQLEDDALTDFLHDWVVGISGIDNANVRPRWQPEPANIPAENVNWLAFGIIRRLTDTYAAEVHNASDPGYNQTRRHEVLFLAATFYGPNRNAYARRLREGMQVAQNREILSLNNMGLVESGDIMTSPEQVKDKWYPGATFTFSIRRQLVSDYAVRNILSSGIELDNVHYVETITVI